MYITEQSEKVTSMGEYLANFRDKVQETFSENQMSEENKTRELQRILRKLKNGAKLTGEELNFIRQNYPQMYAHVVRVQNQRQQLENQFKSAKSKEEVSEIFSNAMLGIAKDDPDKEMLQAAYSKVYSEFQNTPEYKSLPDTKEDAMKKKNNKNTQKPQEKDQVEEERKKFLYPEFDVNG